MRTPLRLLATLLAVTLLATANAQATRALDWIDKHRTFLLEFKRFSLDVGHELGVLDPYETRTLFTIYDDYDRANALYNRAADLRDRLFELADEWEAIADGLNSYSQKDLALERAVYTAYEVLLAQLSYIRVLFTDPVGMTYDQHRDMQKDMDQWFEIESLWLTIYWLQ